LPRQKSPPWLKNKGGGVPTRKNDYEGEYDQGGVRTQIFKKEILFAAIPSFSFFIFGISTNFILVLFSPFRHILY
jgi:hypothetical protein